jgi:hypothetical protein
VAEDRPLPGRARPPAQRLPLFKYNIEGVTVSLPIDPPILPSHADIVEVHTSPFEVAIVFAALPFQLTSESTRKGGHVFAHPVASVIMRRDVARNLIAVLTEAIEGSGGAEEER